MEEYEKTFELNVSAVWFSIMAFLPLLEKGNEKGNVAQRSQVLTTSSIAGFYRLAPGGFAYGQSKAAATHLMKQLASNLAPYKIRCNVLAPGLFPSEAAASIIADSDFPIEKIPLQRPGTEEEMGGATLYLASQAGGYCNGSVLLIDGGRLSMMPSTY